ncbi:Rtf2 RING-finger-domain-containing protein [Lentinula detonsa]|uniref:Rtf2 RING-finger-domain-containing protein n=1 Tax=Lentinula detonsa TaxID=2804962 RepID=A0A9W8TTD3_9AGAR|nr:Rtf2 RING-finger-domain-containing protein [Lentinula detonsa]
MGNDGGSIPDRRDLVRTKAKAEQADKANQTRARWFFCALSKRPLQDPVVSCALGKLYNKDSILEYLIDKSAYGDGENICGHIRSLKDVKTLKLTPNPSLSSSTLSEPTSRSPFVCPLNLKEMNGVQPFVYISTCGCVFSQAGLKTVVSASSMSSSPKEKDSHTELGEVATSDSELEICPQCATKFSRKNDVLMLNPQPEEEERMREKMELQRSKEPKKTKKRKNASPMDDTEAPAKKKALPAMHPSMTAASRAALAMEEAKRKATMSEAVKSLYGDGKPAKKETFMTRGTFTRYA